MSIKSLISKFFSRRDGTAAVEYALLLALVGGGILGAVNLLATSTSNQMVEKSACVGSDNPEADC
ncbi:MAG: hypothetical protein R3316_12245 [Rhodovibrionaceae bacterium]|nr:hypothetical protein [Rhodovibrionaceae bacterium]